MTDTDRARIYGTSPRQIRRWRKAGAPLDDEVAMGPWREAHKRRRGHRYSGTAERAGVTPAIPAPHTPEPATFELTQQPNLVDLSAVPESPLDRAILAEKLAFEKYQATGDSRECLAWTHATDARRKIENDARAHAEAVTEGDQQLANVTLYVLERFMDELEKLPEYAAMVSVGSLHADAQPVIDKVQEYIDGMFSVLAQELFGAVRGTALASLFPLPPEVEAEYQRAEARNPDFLKRPPNKRQAETCLPGGDN